MVTLLARLDADSVAGGAALQGQVPAIIFGPGSIAQAHKPDEHIVLSDYLAAIEHLIDFIPRWCDANVA